jgi:hypothetical protein
MDPWYQTEPDEISLEAANAILLDQDARAQFPNQWNAVLASVKTRVDQLQKQAEDANRLAWVQPSYEQSLKLNVWIWGIDYVVDFDANRIGKTAGGVLNCLLWELPNDPEWKMFRWFTDHLNRRFKILRRPPVSAIREIRKFLVANKLNPDPRLPFDHPENIEIYNKVAVWINDKVKDKKNSFPPVARKRMIWAGGPDKDWITKEVLMPEFIKWTPKHVAAVVSAYDCRMVLKFVGDDQKNHEVTILFKSYDSDDTKWSGGAVDAILLSEGVPRDVFNEVRQRYKYPAYGSWDYTPYEPRNTMGKSALAHSVYKDPTKLPLSPYVFSGFGIVDAPSYILADDKRADLIKNWEGDPQGDARIRGLFYSSSPVVLKHYAPNIHALQMSFEALRAMWAPKPLILFRGVDPGWGHVTACAWMALCPDNSKVIYKFYSRSQRSIEERCQDIIEMSGNKRLVHPKHPQLWKEESSRETAIKMTFIDHHTFKTDEVTKRPFAYNYINNGLLVRPSVTVGPKERATLFNGLLLPQAHLPHPESRRPPGSKLYFLINEEGVASAVNKMTNLFWLTFEKGEKRGLTKDTVQDYDDDELDAACYVACPTLIYSSFFQHSASTKNDSSSARSNTRLSYATDWVAAS